MKSCLMKSWLSRAVLLVAAACVPQARAALVTMRSGNGPVGGTDSRVTMLVGPAGTGFGAAFTAADFAAARAGAHAHVIDPYPAWTPSLFNDPQAKWIATDPDPVQGRSALYAIDFELAEVPGSAVLELNFLVDNQLGGDGVNAGLFLNGHALGSPPGDYITQVPYTSDDIASWLGAGTNTLYLYVYDYGQPTGLIFSVSLNGSAVAVPEPASVVLMATAALGGIVLQRRRRAVRPVSQSIGLAEGAGSSGEG